MSKNIPFLNVFQFNIFKKVFKNLFIAGFCHSECIIDQDSTYNLIMINNGIVANYESILLKYNIVEEG